VFFISSLSPKAPLRYVNDPLQLSTFFPVPRPLNFMRKITTLVPTPLYEQYKQQASELNEITRRLKAIIKAIRYRGAYNSTVEGIEKMLNADDNELVAVENIQSMPDSAQSMDKLLYTVPVNELVATATALSQAREAIKQVIYEITGISDILRGASVASETATAQNIKNQWGTLRLKKMQKEVQRYARESIALMLEIAAAKFEQQTFQQMTGLPYLTMADKQQLQQQIQTVTEQAAMQAQASGQPPQPPLVPPEIEQALKEPTWEEILQTMKNDITLHYKVDIETNSTIDAEASQDKQDISELLNALSQFLNGIAPLVEQGVMTIDVAKAMLLTISRRYNFGSQLEDALGQMKAALPKSDPAADAKNQALALQAKVDQAKADAELRSIQAKGALEQQQFEHERDMALLEQQIAREGLAIKQEELRMQRQAIGMKMELQNTTHKQKMEAASKPKEGVN
jgi:hypothetical protein